MSRRLHYHQTSTDSYSSPFGKTPGGPSTPIIPLRFWSLCVSLGSHVEVDLYGVNPTTSERRVLVMSTFISLLSFSQLRVLIFPTFCSLPAATFVSYLGFSVTAVMRVPSGLPNFLKLFLRRPHLMWMLHVPPLYLLEHSPSLSETVHTDHLGRWPVLYARIRFLRFDFCDLVHQSDTFLSLKPVVEPLLPVLFNQAKEFQPVSCSCVYDNLWINCCYEQHSQHSIEHLS